MQNTLVPIKTILLILILTVQSLPAYSGSHKCIIPETQNTVMEPKDIDVIARNRPYLGKLESRYGANHLKYADALVRHAENCWRAGLYKETESSYKKAIAIYERKLARIIHQIRF